MAKQHRKAAVAPKVGVAQPDDAARSAPGEGDGKAGCGHDTAGTSQAAQQSVVAGESVAELQKAYDDVVAALGVEHKAAIMAKVALDAEKAKAPSPLASLHSASSQAQMLRTSRKVKQLQGKVAKQKVQVEQAKEAAARALAAADDEEAKLGDSEEKLRVAMEEQSAHAAQIISTPIATGAVEASGDCKAKAIMQQMAELHAKLLLRLQGNDMDEDDDPDEEEAEPALTRKAAEEADPALAAREAAEAPKVNVPRVVPPPGEQLAGILGGNTAEDKGPAGGKRDRTRSPARGAAATGSG